MNFPDIVNKLFETPDGHQAKVILIGATDQANFSHIWEKHQIEEYTDDMDEKASKLGLSYTPVIVVINTGKDGHMDANISLPTQKWIAGLNIDTTIERSRDLRRATDWVAGFMEMFTMTGSISAVAVDTGDVMFGDPKNSLFKLENILKDISPKQARSDLMTADLDIGSVEDIMGQMSPKEIDELNPVEKAVKDSKDELVGLFSDAMKRGGKKASMTIIDESPEAVAIPMVIMETDEEKMRRTQQEVVDKYGFAALKDLVKRTNQPLLVKKPKV